MPRYAVLCAALFAGSVVFSAPVELLSEGGFESGLGPGGTPVGWTVVEGHVRLSGDHVRTGALALEAEDPGPGPAVSVESQRWPCRPGSLYVALAWLRSEEPARPSLYLQFFAAAGQRVGAIARFPPRAADWVPVSLSALPPRDASSVSLLIFSGSGETGRFQADDVVLQEWSLAELGLAGRVPNPGFETVSLTAEAPPGWFSAAGDMAVVSDAARAGTRSLRLDAGAGGKATLSSAWSEARPGQRWRASSWARAEVGARARLAITFVDAFLDARGGAESTTESPDWTEVTTEAVAPAGTTGVLLCLSAATGRAWHDDTTLRRVPKEGPEVVDIGRQRQLFLDDFIVDETALLERVWHLPAKEPEPVIVPDQPWEQSSFLGVIGNTLFFDGGSGHYRMYYVIYEMIGLAERQHYALAVSRDGRHWEKPNLGLADFKGSRANNLLHDYESPRHQKELFFYNNILRDPHDPDPARRYKALGFMLNHQTGSRGMLVAFSPDGLRFTDAPENPVLPNGDTNTLLGWDDRIGKYVAYPRTDGPTSARDIGYTTSDDFIHWSPATTVMEPIAGDPPHYEIYGMPVVQYEGLYLGFPWAFIANGLEPLDTQLAFSRDGVAWQRDPRAPKFIPRGPAGTFDDSYAITANPILVGDELLFYYMACGFPHGYAFVNETRFDGTIGLARLRLDGFVSLSCHAGSGGYLVTRPIRFSGSRLVVNCDSPKGWLRAELQRADGTPVSGHAEADCDPVSADSTRQPISWRGSADVSALAGEPVRLRLVIGDGQIYSFGFVD